MRRLRDVTGIAVLAAIAVVQAGPDEPMAVPIASMQVTFEAASITLNKSAGPSSFVGRQPGGRFTATNATLGELIRYAWQLQPFQMQGGPSWLESDRWDILATLATIPPPPAPGQIDDTVRAVRALLEQRFRLIAHRETQPLPIYALVLSRADGRLGPGMQRSTLDCAALMASRGRGGAPPTPAASGGPPCGLSGRIGSIRSGGVPLTELAEALSTRVQRTVVDRTGLAGNWEFALTYASDPSQIARGTLAPGDQPPAPDQNAASLFTALQEQLGLRLESTRGPVDVFVIDRADHATAN